MALPAWAQANDRVDWSKVRNEFDPTPLELAKLPLYCQGQFRPELAAQNPAYRMPDCGPKFNHFCPALVALIRARDPMLLPGNRKYSLSHVPPHLKYTTDSMPASCALAADVRAAETLYRALAASMK